MLAIDGHAQSIVPVVHPLAGDVTVLCGVLQVRLQPVAADESRQHGLVPLHRELQPVLESELVVAGLEHVRGKSVGYVEPAALSTTPEHASRSQAQAAHGHEEHSLAESQKVRRPHTAVAVGQDTEPVTDSRQSDEKPEPLSIPHGPSARQL